MRALPRPRWRPWQSAVVAAGCGSTSTGSSDGKVDVVATTTQIGDWTRVVGGDQANVHQLLQPNTDPHEYEPRPADVEALANAKVVFTNGDGLDEWIANLVDEAGGDPEVVDLTEQLPSQLPGETTGPERSEHDPHWWHDPRNATAAVREIARRARARRTLGTGELRAAGRSVRDEAPDAGRADPGLHRQDPGEPPQARHRP